MLLRQGRRRLFIWGMVGCGLICLTIAAVAAISTSRFLRTAVRTKGTVVELVRRDHAYHPVFTFHDVERTAHKVKSSFGASWQLHRVDEVVPIVYDPSNPSKAQIDSPLRHWWVTLFTGVVGLSYLLISTAVHCMPRIVERLKTPQAKPAVSSRWWPFILPPTSLAPVHWGCWYQRRGTGSEARGRGAHRDDACCRRIGMDDRLVLRSLGDPDGRRHLRRERRGPVGG